VLAHLTEVLNGFELYSVVERLLLSPLDFYLLDVFVLLDPIQMLLLLHTEVLGLLLSPFGALLLLLQVVLPQLVDVQEPFQTQITPKLCFLFLLVIFKKLLVTLFFAIRIWLREERVRAVPSRLNLLLEEVRLSLVVNACYFMLFRSLFNADVGTLYLLLDLLKG